MRPIAPTAAEKAEELVEAAIQRMTFVLLAQMPLAHQGCAVARLPQILRHRRDVRIHSTLARRNPVGHTDAQLMPSGHQRSPRRAAHRAGNVAIGEANAAGGQCIQMRSWNITTSVRATIGVAHVICYDEEDVGARRTSGVERDWRRQ